MIPIKVNEPVQQHFTQDLLQSNFFEPHDDKIYIMTLSSFGHGQTTQTQINHSIKLTEMQDTTVQHPKTEHGLIITVKDENVHWLICV